MKNIRIARLSTVRFFIVTQLRTQLEQIVAAGADLTVISNKDDELVNDDGAADSARFIHVDFCREINVVKDMKALLNLIRLFKREKFDIVHSVTPKAGLLTAIAGRIAGVRTRVHTFTGQPWVTMSGPKRKILIYCDRIIGFLNTCCYTDSRSQREFLIENRIVRRSRIRVLGEGSLAGIDLRRFDPEKYTADGKMQFRTSLGIRPDSVVLLFVGRITRDKGIRELLNAFETLIEQGADVHLLLVGPFEADGRLLLDEMSERLDQNRLVIVGFSAEPEKFMAISDIFCLPSHREGFGTVVIEAGAMGLPTVASNIYGLSDAVVAGDTGLLTTLEDPASLANALASLVINPAQRRRMGESARKRVVRHFDSEYMGELLIAEYESLLGLKASN
ncbi:hypothetical protein LCGC14_0144600 [marine sediment metagenome]|uniref:Glycosyltransferase family 1 protein n=3 Tax=root TaxID=1 RepID=A0A7V1BRU4_9GAMM|nr:glycosyltransferase family 4 protein [Marinobacter antarcticus]HDZ58029.1 glycosyltransferase family 1 protein [Halopseudomonas xinjiangensis]HEA51020.1 glycosyltransferase family 1 protein [Marinobacter antarcticus]